MAALRDLLQRDLRRERRIAEIDRQPSIEGNGAFDPERSFKSRFGAGIYLNSSGESWAAPMSLFFGE
jgi:hypothetical protein